MEMAGCGMKQFMAGAAAGVLALGWVALPQGEVSGGQPRTSAATSVCLYMVRHVERTDGIYLGEFVVLRKTGPKVKGYGGAFYSEGFNLKGTITGTRAVLSSEDPYQPGKWTRTTLKWVPAQSRLAGWKRVQKSRLRKYSGGYVPVKGRTCG
jgi:hypothetical protein